jgi:hypothetical protein
VAQFILIYLRLKAKVDVTENSFVNSDCPFLEPRKLLKLNSCLKHFILAKKLNRKELRSIEE